MIFTGTRNTSANLELTINTAITPAMQAQKGMPFWPVKVSRISENRP